MEGLTLTKFQVPAVKDEGPNCFKRKKCWYLSRIEECLYMHLNSWQVGGKFKLIWTGLHVLPEVCHTKTIPAEGFCKPSIGFVMLYVK